MDNDRELQAAVERGAGHRSPTVHSREAHSLAGHLPDPGDLESLLLSPHPARNRVTND